MHQWLAQTQIVQNISKDLLKPRQEYYSEDVYFLKMQDHTQFYIKHLNTKNNHSEKLYAVVVDRRTQKSDYCIIYMHGMGSNILQGSMLIDHLPHNIALCCFDFSGSGKSQGKYSTFGVKQYRDIDYIITLLKKQGYKKFILWGRSMGAFASLAYSSTHLFNNSCVLQILDSPFSNFESVCKQRAKNHYGFPDFIANYSVNLLKKNLNSHPYNPFDFNLKQKASNCTIPTIFIYNQKDDVIPSHNTEELIDQVSKKCSYQRLIITDQHNSNRSEDTFQRIFMKIRKVVSFPDKEKFKTSRKALNVCCIDIKKEGSAKNLYQSNKTQPTTQRRKAMYCSLSKDIKKSSKVNSWKLKLGNNPEKSFI